MRLAIPLRRNRQYFHYYERCNTRGGQSGVRLVTGTNEYRNGRWVTISKRYGSCVNRA